MPIYMLKVAVTCPSFNLVNAISLYPYPKSRPGGNTTGEPQTRTPLQFCPALMSES